MGIGKRGNGKVKIKNKRREEQMGMKKE